MEIVAGRDSELLAALFDKVTTELNVEEWMYGDGRVVSSEDYNLYLFDRNDHRGLKLEDRGTGKLALEFMFGSRRAAAFIQSGNEVWLAHTGRVHRDRQRPSSQRTGTVDGRTFFLVTSLESRNILSDLIRFHESRGEVPIQSETVLAIDSGPLKGGTRAAVEFEAQHAPVVKALASQLEYYGWKAVTRIGNANPDLVIERESISGERRRVLFEVKSGCDVHSLICAVGQCKVYDLEYTTDRQIIVGMTSGDILDSVDAWISEAIRELGIELVLASGSSETGFRFSFRFQPADELVTRAT